MTYDQIEVREVLKFDLKPDEVVVSATTLRDVVIIVTDRGTVYQIRNV